jgi:hypothetical protein
MKNPFWKNERLLPILATFARHPKPIELELSGDS